MDKYSPELLLEMWREGKTLEKAIWEYSSEKYRKNYPRLPEYSSRDKIKDTPLGEMFSEALKHLNDINQSHRNYEAESASAIEDMQADVFNKVINGKLLAIGYEYPPQSDFPVIVPLYMWPPESLNTEDSSIVAHELKFVRVRIIKQSKANSPKKVKLPNLTPKPKKGGRPTIRSKIKAAYITLEENGKIHSDEPLSIYTEMIQEMVRIMYPETASNKGMGQETIRRTVREYLSTK